MKIKIDKEFRVLKESNIINLQSFTVITGENGSGKSQLLKWIDLNCQGIYEDYQHNGLPTNDSNPHTISGIVTKNDNTPYSSVIRTLPGITPVQTGNIANSNSLINYIIDNWDKLQYTAWACSIVSGLNEINAINKIEEINTIAQKFVRMGTPTNNGNQNLPHNYIHIQTVLEALHIAKKSNKNLQELTIIDAIAFFNIENSQLKESTLEILFHQYELKKKYYPHFVNDLKPPLIVLNEILESANFKYRAEYSFINGEKFLSPIVLRDLSNENTIIIPEELSSGEKTIMSIMTALYNSNTNGAFPELILYDEPDAFLHPSLTQMMLNVIKEVIVKENGVDVIMTTHSPSTVAIAPEESIYYMKRDVGYPVKISQGEAINSLIYGINGLFVSHENRRQVFVESEKDERFYEYIYNYLKDKLNKNVQLIFIASSKTKIASNGEGIGTREQVESITKIMRDSDNKQIWGIVDWDKKQTKHPNVVRIGNGKRYTIENYLLDPLLLGILLIKDGLVLPKEMGLAHGNYLSLANSNNNADFQIITNWVLKLLKLYTEKSEELRIEKLVNGMEIKLPIKFLEMDGHDFENNLSKKIHKLGTVTSSQSNDNSIKLKMAIIERVLFDLPELISIDFLTTFKYIQETR